MGECLSPTDCRPTSRRNGQRFIGLAKSSSRAAVLDGDGKSHGNWWNCVGATRLHRGGIPGWNKVVAQSVELKIVRVSSSSPQLTYTAGSSWKVIARQTSTALFDTSSKNSFLMNEGDPNAAAYMSIGRLNAADCRGADGKYHLQLIWDGSTWASTTIEWKQTSWLTEDTIRGFECLSPTDCRPTSRRNGQRFTGLAKSSSRAAVLDGDGKSHGNWWNCVGATRLHRGGIPGWNKVVAQSVELKIVRVSSSSPQLTYTAGSSWKVIARQTSTALFDTSSKNSFLMNEGGPNAAAYMSIGRLNAADCRGADGKYH